jgi:hypothetical protein
MFEIAQSGRELEFNERTKRGREISVGEKNV